MEFNSDLLRALTFLSVAQLVVWSVMGFVYHLGKDSVWSSLLIYGPINLISLVCFRDQMDSRFTLSCLLSITHGIAHNLYPFLDEQVGVVRSVDVWQDQIVHLGQAILFGTILYGKIGKGPLLGVFLFVLANVLNVVLGYLCWGKWCHNQYVWMSLAPALASGLHFAMGCFSGTVDRDSETKMAMKGFAIQGTSSILTYFMFKSSDDILKLFARCRFFEVYFIIPHYIGFFYSRYLDSAAASDKSANKTADNQLGIRILRTLGVLPISSANQNDKEKKM